MNKKYDNITCWEYAKNHYNKQLCNLVFVGRTLQHRRYHENFAANDISSVLFCIMGRLQSIHAIATHAEEQIWPTAQLHTSINQSINQSINHGFLEWPKYLKHC